MGPNIELFDFIDDRKKEFAQLLRDAVAIPSVSCAIEMRDHVIEMAKWLANYMKSLGMKVEHRCLEPETRSDGTKVKRPPVLLAQTIPDNFKKTLCFYGHYDVQPAIVEEHWNPFELFVHENHLFGRGTVDNKGPILCCLNAIYAYQQCNIPLPVNIKILYEGMQEIGSIGLEEVFKRKGETFFENVDYVCVTDSYWLDENTPCLTYGHRGICHFEFEIKCACKNLHSGIYGGTFNEGMNDLMYLLNKLIDVKGNISIPRIYENVRPLSSYEMKNVKLINFNVLDYRTEIGANELLHDENKNKILIHRSRFPSLSIHGIEGAFSGSGCKAVIPAKVKGKFTIRIVPDQNIETTEATVVQYFNDLWRSRGSKNTFKVEMIYGNNPWMTDPTNDNFEAAASAIRTVYNVEPYYTYEGSTTHIARMMENISRKNVLLLPIGAKDDSPHSQREKINKRNYIEGTKVLAAYMQEIAQIGRDDDSSSSSSSVGLPMRHVAPFLQ